MFVKFRRCNIQPYPTKIPSDISTAVSFAESESVSDVIYIRRYFIAEKVPTAADTLKTQIYFIYFFKLISSTILS